MPACKGRTVLLTVMLVGTHGLPRGGTGDQLVAELGLVLLVAVVEVVIFLVGAGLVRVVVWWG